MGEPRRPEPHLRVPEIRVVFCAPHVPALLSPWAFAYHGLPWNERPQSMFDYREKIQHETIPYVAHEMGQYCVFPNFNEISKYTGSYRAKNFELFQNKNMFH